MGANLKWPIDTYARQHPELRKPLEHIHEDFVQAFSGLRQLDSKITATAGGTLDVRLNPGESFFQYALIHVSRDKVASLADRSSGEGNEATHILVEIGKDGKGKAARKADGVWIPIASYSTSGLQHLFLGESGGLSNTKSTDIGGGQVDQEVGLFYLPDDNGLYECWLFIEPYGLT